MRAATTFCALLVAGASASAQQCELRWVEGYHEPFFGAVYEGAGPRDALVFDDGSGTALYVGGAFSSVGALEARNIVRWDGERWSTLGTGTATLVNALAVFDENGAGPLLFAGGNFNEAGGLQARRVARWDGASWSSLGTGMNADVEALAVHDDGGGAALYAGGRFWSAGGTAADRIARWNGTSWSAVGSGFDQDVLALTSWDDGGTTALYAGGRFTLADGKNASRVARWDGTSWSPLGSGVDGVVRDLFVWDDGGGSALYACGDFQTAGGLAASRVARWDGTQWSVLGAGLVGSETHCMAAHDDGSGPGLWVGGRIQTAGGSPAGDIVRWDGSSWSSPVPDTSGAVHALLPYDLGDTSGDRPAPALFAGGAFTQAGDLVVGGAARWDGTSWSAYPGHGYGVAGPVTALETFDDGTGLALYAGGSFPGAGQAAAHDVARWDGSDWSALGASVDGWVKALEVFDDGTGPALYAGGELTLAGTTPVSRIARWDGSAWSALGSGVGSSVNALQAWDDGGGSALYVAGSFTTAGGGAANRIARWDGSGWSALGAGVDGPVYALQAWGDGSGSALYAGGVFMNAGGAPAPQVARWDGTSWSALSVSGLSGVRSFTIHDSGAGPELFAGDSFGRVRRWNGTAWSSLGVDLSGGAVRALRTYDEGTRQVLVAGGDFFTGGGQDLAHIARWDGTSWSPLGGGVVGPFQTYVAALREFDDGSGSGPSLFVGGDFGKAGPELVRSFARWARDCTGTSFCFGDGSGTPCPCGNDGASGHGCENSAAAAGARLFGGGDVVTNAVVLRGEDLPATTVALAVRSTEQANGGLGSLFGDGLLCLGVPVVRLATGFADDGVVRIPISHGAGAGVFHYQLWYRNAAAFCTPDRFNLSNGLTIVWP